MRHISLLLIAALLVGCSGVVESDGPIALEKIGTIHGPDEGFDGLPLISPSFSDGTRLAIVPWVGTPRPVFIVNADGAVTDTLATNGEGPGQVANPVWTIRGLGDTALVVGRGMIHLFAPDHRYVRSFPTAFGGTWAAAQGPDGTIALASNSVGGREEVVAGLSPADGSRRFSIEGPSFERERVPENRFVALAPDGTWWTVRAWGSYVLQHYSREGALLQTIQLTAEWYPPRLVWGNMAGKHAPNTALTGFWIDSAGRAWVLGQAADPDWESAEGEMVRSEGQEVFVAKRYSDVRDGILEVVDLEKGQPIATWRRDEIFGPMAEPGVMYVWRTDEDGWTEVDLYRVVPRF